MKGCFTHDTLFAKLQKRIHKTASLFLVHAVDCASTTATIGSHTLFLLLFICSCSEYIKPRLLNKDSRFRKDNQYVFYILWQKELRVLAAGVCNVLQANIGNPKSVHELVHNVNISDERLEANLCTMLQLVRGTSQYWRLMKGELHCMLREWGPPSLFLMLSCAEYVCVC